MKGDKIYSDLRKILYYLALVFLHYIIHHWSHIVFGYTHVFKKLCFLTNISLYLNTIYYTSMLLVHLKLIKFNANFEKGLFKFSYCISFVVFLLYWGMVITNPSLLYNGSFKIPIGLDLLLHGANYILNVVEVKLINPRENYNIKLFFYIAFCVIYALMLKFVLHFLEWSTYRFVEHSNLLEYLIIIVIALGLVLIADFTYSFVSIRSKVHKEHVHTHIHQKTN